MGLLCKGIKCGVAKFGSGMSPQGPCVKGLAQLMSLKRVESLKGDPCKKFGVIGLYLSEGL